MVFTSATRCALVALFVLWFAPDSRAQLPPTQLRVLYPPVVQVGSTTTVEVLGHGPLEEIDRLFFSHPGLSANIILAEPNPLTKDKKKQFGKFNLYVATEVPPGFYEVWAAGRNGVSSSRIVWVVQRALLSAPQPATENDPAPKLTLDGLVIDRFAAAKVHRYQLELSTGQKIRLTAQDAKLDSRAICQLRITTPDGKLVAAARSNAIDGAQTEFTASQTGMYHIEVRDAVYRGGDEFFFALWAEPIEAAPLDPAIGAWKDRQAIVSALAPTTGQLSLARQLASLSVSHLISSDHPFITSVSGRDQPLAVKVPCLISGVFSTSIHDQTFDFAAKKGESYCINVLSQQLNEATDPQLSIFKLPPSSSELAAGSAAAPAKPEQIAEQDDATAIGTPPMRVARADPSYRFDVPADGRYRVVIRDQFATNAATSGKRYLLAIHPPRPGLSVIAAWAWPTNNAALARPIGNLLMMGGSSAIRVIVNRVDGLTGAVEVACENLPDGVTAAPIIIPADKDEGHLVLVNQETSPAHTGPIKITARAVGDADNKTKIKAGAAQLNWEPIPTWNALTHRLSQQLLISVSDKDASPISFSVADGGSLATARGGKVTIPIKLMRRAGGADKVVLRAQGLPAKTTVADITIEGAASEGKGELVVAADAPVGEASVWFQAETKVKLRNNPQAFDRAEAERAQLEKMQADPALAAQKDAVAAALKLATEQVTKLKELTAEREQAVFLPTHNVRIKIVEAPIEPVAEWRIEVKRGTEADHRLTINRLFAFDDAVDAKLVADAAAAGLEVTPAQFAKGMTESICHIKATTDAAIGERRLKLTLTYKLNGKDFSVERPLLVSVNE